MTFELDVGKILLVSCQEVDTCRCAPLNQCEMEFCSDGISIIIATILFMYEVDYNKLIIIITNILLELCYNYSHTIHVRFIFFIQFSLIFPFDPLLGHDFLHVYKIIS